MNKIYDLIKEKCPEGVEYKQLGDVCEFIRGKGLSKSSKNENGDTCIILYGELYTTYGNYITKIVSHADLEEASKSTLVKKNDILIPVSSTTKEAQIGKASAVYVDETIYLGGDAVCLRHKQNPGFLVHLLNSAWFEQRKMKHVRGTTIMHLSPDGLKKIKIPVPPLDIQKEIVNVLDSFTELEAELGAELEARQKQYGYYRELLLSQSNPSLTDAPIKRIAELSQFRRGSFPQPYGKSEWYDGEGAMPFVQVADISDNMQLVPDTKRKISRVAQPKSVFAPKGSIIISLQGSIGRIAVTQYDAFIDRTVAIFTSVSDEINPKYFVYQLQRIFSIKEKNARGSTIKTITKEEFMDFPIPVPNVQEQNRIVSVLDKFDALTSDISNGLPAEIEARRKQYEYYRDKLLTFKEKVVK